MSLADIVGPQLLSGRSLVPTASVIQSSKYVALYFSAHWCGPCRNFTPMLAQSYNYLKSQGIQVIFVSSDHDEQSFNEYYGQMPWKAVPFHFSGRSSLGDKFNVQGIPKLVILHADGRLVTTEGVEMLRSDPSGQRLLSQLSQQSQSFSSSLSSPFMAPAQQFQRPNSFPEMTAQHFQRPNSFPQSFPQYQHFQPQPHLSYRF